MPPIYSTNPTTPPPPNPPPPGTLPSPPPANPGELWSIIDSIAYVGTPTQGSEITTVPRDTLNSVGASQLPQDMQLQTAAVGAPIGFGYGRMRIGLQILHPIVNGAGSLLIPAFVSQGPIDAIEAIEVNNEALASGISVTSYLGAPGQGVDSALAAAWTIRGKTYADAHDGMAYVVLAVPPVPENRIGNFTAQVRLLKVYDPRLDSTNGGSGSHRFANPATWAWSQNPVLAMAHFLAVPGFGPGESLDWASVITCANIADQQLTTGGVTENRRVLGGIYFREQQQTEQIEEVLRSYAGVFIVRDGPLVRLIADAAGSVGYAFTSANYVRDTLTLARRQRDNAPTVVTVQWTDTTQKPWATQEATVKADGVDAGLLPWVESVIRWPGCQSAGMATREGVRRLNEFNVADLTASLVGVDDSLKLRKGEIVSVTDAEGLSAKQFRLTGVVPQGPGRWNAQLSEYHAALYSDTVYTGPTIPDAGLPSPSTPPTPSGLTLTEEVYQERGGGMYASRIKVAWTAATWPFVEHYQVIIKQGANVIDSALVQRASTPEYRTPSLQEAVTYTVTLAIVSTTGAISATPASDTLAILGTKLPPGDVPSMSGFAIGGEVLLFWTAAADIDLTGYEIRIGPTSATWATAATYIDRLDALTARIKGLPAGTWRVFIKARDSIRTAANPYGQYSTNAIYVDVVIDADEGAFLLTQYQYTTPNLTYMVAQPREGLPTVYLTDTLSTFGSLFTSTLGTYTNPLATYHTSGTSRLLTESFDFGSVVTGNFTATINYTDLSGVAQPYIELSTNGTDWTRYDALTTKQAARYARVGIEATGTETMKVTGLPTIRLDAVARSESSGGTVTSAASGATTINLSGHYNKIVDLAIVVEGTTGKYVTYNNIVLHPTNQNSFDVYVFNAAGTQISALFRWSLTGI